MRENAFVAVNSWACDKLGTFPSDRFPNPSVSSGCAALWVKRSALPVRWLFQAKHTIIIKTNGIRNINNDLSKSLLFTESFMQVPTHKPAPAKPNKIEVIGRVLKA